MSTQSNAPPAPREVDIKISQHQGETFALDLMPKKLQKFKNQPTPSLKEMIETLSKENGRLRVELTHYQELQSLGDKLRQEVDYAINRLKMAVITFKKGQADIKTDFETIYNTIKDIKTR